MANTNWWANIKYVYDGTYDRVPISKIREHSPTEYLIRTGQKYMPFNPSSKGEFEQYTVYSVYSAKNMPGEEDQPAEELLWKCYIGALAGELRRTL